jgi:hypothetical protein
MFSISAQSDIVCGPKSFPDLTHYDFHLPGILKDKVYKINTHTQKELRNCIPPEISAISKEALNTVNTKLS